jgi:hypothetical protein
VVFPEPVPPAIPITRGSGLIFIFLLYPRRRFYAHL